MREGVRVEPGVRGDSCLDRVDFRERGDEGLGGGEEREGSCSICARRCFTTERWSRFAIDGLLDRCCVPLGERSEGEAVRVVEPDPRRERPRGESWREIRIGNADECSLVTGTTSGVSGKERSEYSKDCAFVLSVLGVPCDSLTEYADGSAEELVDGTSVLIIKRPGISG